MYRFLLNLYITKTVNPVFVVEIKGMESIKFTEHSIHCRVSYSFKVPTTG